MAQFLTFDIDRKKRISFAVSDQSCALDMNRIPITVDPTTGLNRFEATPHSWQLMSVLLRGEMSIDDIEQNLLDLAESIRDRYGQLERFADKSSAAQDRQADRVWRVRQHSRLIY